MDEVPRQGPPRAGSAREQAADSRLRGSLGLCAPSPKEAAQAFPRAARLSQLAPGDLEIWEIVRELAKGLGQQDWYDRAARQCARLSPQTPSQPK